MTPDFGFVHIYRPGASENAPTLLLLHGTGGDEHDLLPLGEGLAPGAAVLSPRGQVLEHGMPRFFRRLAEGVFDEADVTRRAADLAGFLRRAAAQYHFRHDRVIALGFSNGANIASAVMLLHPDVLAGAILFRAMVPLVPSPLPSLSQKRALVSNGRRDPIVSVSETERLTELLRSTGADVELQWQNAGHELTPADIRVARSWMASLPPT